jgi:hypothetical protein
MSFGMMAYDAQYDELPQDELPQGQYDEQEQQDPYADAMEVD